MIPAEILPRLAKLLPLLASDKDGEVVATARAICRTLTGAGTDLHALAKHLTDGTPDWAAPIDWGAAFAEASAKTWANPEPKPDPDAPEARARRWGYPIWGVKKVEPWKVVADHCLNLDWSIPKASGGKFLAKADRERLKTFSRGAFVSNADADWLEGIVLRCHEVRDAWRSQKTKAAA